MARIDEQKMIAEFVGNKINMDTFGVVALPNGCGYGDYADCDEYIVYHDEYYDDECLATIFKITPTIAEKWDYDGIDFRLYLYIKEGFFMGGCLFKYRDTTCSSHFRPTGYMLTPTQQEIRIAKRILEYIIEK
jgi:hypothetical protein